jgi:hypothetical protein
VSPTVVHCLFDCVTKAQHSIQSQVVSSAFVGLLSSLIDRAVLRLPGSALTTKVGLSYLMRINSTKHTFSISMILYKLVFLPYRISLICLPIMSPSRWLITAARDRKEG